MKLRRLRRPSRGYDSTLTDVLGQPGRRETDALALVWAHAIAWAAHSKPQLDEVEVLSLAAARYGVPVSAVMDERARQLSAPPVVPAARPLKTEGVEDYRSLHRPA